MIRKLNTCTCLSFTFSLSFGRLSSWMFNYKGCLDKPDRWWSDKEKSGLDPMNLLMKSDNHLTNANENANAKCKWIEPNEYVGHWLYQIICGLDWKLFSFGLSSLILVKLVIGFCSGKDTVWKRLALCYFWPWSKVLLI